MFDIDRFASFEGNTGPYILYTAVRIQSILKKHAAAGGAPVDGRELLPAEAGSEKALQLLLAQYPEVAEGAWRELAPHRICQYLYSVAETFNGFYHEIPILSEPDEGKKRSYLALIQETVKVLGLCLNMLGMEIPERM